MPMNKIVVGVDESEGAGEALAWAAREADLRGTALTAVLAWGYLDQHTTTKAKGRDSFDPDYDEGDAAEALDTIVERTLGAEPSADVTRLTVNDLAPAALIAAADDADLLVVGARGLGGFRGLLVGSVSQHVLHHAPCAVAVVRVAPARVEGRRERIVVGIDGSDTAQQALTWALDEGRARQAAVEVVHAWNPPYVGAYPFDPGALNIDAFEKGAEQVLTEALAKQDTSGLPVPPEAIAVSGTAARAVLDTADGADLVVVGSRGRGGFAGLFLGSVSQQVAHHAPCPVVVIPPDR